MTGRFFKLIFFTLALMLFSCTGVSFAEEKFSADQIEFFEKRIRPLFVNHCSSCHADEISESDFRVDARDHILRGGASDQPGAIAGDAANSLLMAVVGYESDYKMPPDGKLSDQEIADLSRWVSEGLPWPENESVPAHETISDRIDFQQKNHWAFQPISSPPVPEIPTAARVGGGENELSPIDAFLLETLVENGLEFSPPADKSTLIRRATFDLTGLPPTFEEVRTFVADDDPQAYAKLIDRLLASPRYGQHWARHWLDVARYADTLGYALGKLSRDYPFAYTYRDYVVNAFNEDLPYDQFIRQQLAADLLTDDPKDPSLAALGFLTVGRKYLAREDVVDDQIDVVTRGLMGLTVGCARCHDHKFDGIATEDYYSLYGIFNNCDIPEDLPVIGEIAASADEYVAELEKLKSNVADARQAAKQSTREHLFKHIDQYAAAAWLNEPEARLRSVGVISLPTDQYRAVIAGKLKKYWGTLRDNPLVEKIQADLKQAGSFEDRQQVAMQFGASLKEAADKYLQIENPDQPWEEVFPPGSSLHDAAALIFHKNAPPQWRFGLFRVLVKREELKAIGELRSAVNAHSSTSPRGFDRAMVVQDRVQIAEPYVMIRGDIGRRGDTVPRRFPELLSGGQRAGERKYSQGSGRLELANDIASPNNPLTSRVIVNRIWMHHFVNPLVGTPSDFGVQGETPSHVDLLNWLAADFMEAGWSMKALHRKIMLSQAYQQSSLPRDEGRAKDEGNKWLWRMNRRRLEIEALRDSILFVSGSLDESLGGRGVKQFEPPFDNRRTVYGFVDRVKLAVELRTFDLASPDQSAGKRIRTNVPQQGLFLMNSPFVQQQADLLAVRAGAHNSPHDGTFVDRLFRLALSRRPTAEERVTLASYIRSADADGRKRASHLMLMTNEFEFVD